MHDPIIGRRDDAPILADRPLVAPQYTSRFLQGAVLAVLAVSTAVLLVIDPALVASTSYLFGAALILVASSLLLLPGLTSPWYRPWMYAMPFLDIAGIAVIRSAEQGIATSPMVVLLALPAAWVGLTRSHPALALFAIAVATVGSADVVRLVRGDVQGTEADLAVMFAIVSPVVLIVASCIAYAIASVLSDRQDELADEQRRRAEATRGIERTRRLLDTVLDQLDVGVIVSTPSGQPILMNRVLRESPDLAADGRDPRGLFLEVRAFEIDRVTPIAEDDSTFHRVLRGEVVRDRLVWVGPPAGAQSALSVSGGPVHTESGEHLANVLVISDVTAYVRALESKDVFIGTVSHELRTPLTTMRGFLEILLERRDELGEEVAGFLDVMDRSVQRQQLLVRDLLTVAGSRTAPIALDRRPTDLVAVVREAADAVRGEATDKGVELAVELAAASVDAHVDAHRIAQVVENLVTNAIRYTPPGGSVAVTLSEKDASAVLDIRDTGMGISEADRERLFEQFFRAPEARSAAIRGIGLGLPIVQAIVEAHGGEVLVDSAIGKGTTVTVRLPRY